MLIRELLKRELRQNDVDVMVMTRTSYRRLIDEDPNDAMFGGELVQMGKASVIIVPDLYHARIAYTFYLVAGRTVMIVHDEFWSK